MESREVARQSRHKRIRHKITGTAETPRFCVFRSLRHIYAQLIDDSKGQTLVSASDTQIDDKTAQPVIIAQKVGELLATKAKEKKITKAVFDRAGFKYHGQVKALAEGARTKGLQF